MCAPRSAHPVCHTLLPPSRSSRLWERGQRCSWSFSPCKGSSPGSTQLLCQLLMFAEVPPQQDQTFPGPPQSCVPTSPLCSASSSFSHVKSYFFLVNGVAFTVPCPRGALLQSTCSVPSWKAAQRGSVGSTPGAGAGTAQLPLQLQSSGKAEGSKHVLL